MPGGDRTGPAGLGPMTGRSAGYCAGNQVPGSASAPGGRGRGAGGRGGGGRGGRGGRGWRNRFYATGLTGWQRAAEVPASSEPQEVVAPETTPGATSDALNQQALELLKSEAKQYATGLEQIEKRIAELEAKLQES